MTGASSGIGAGIACEFGRYGADIMVQFRKSAQGASETVQRITELGGRGFVHQADLRSEGAIDQLFEVVDNTWGGVDILVNNAGIVHKGSVMSTTSAYWDNTMAINLRAPYLLSRQAARRMTKSTTGGTILNISSILGRRSTEYYSAYAVSKAGLNALTKGLAVEFAPFNIRVNALAPGVVPVKRTENELKQTEDVWLPHIPLKRFGTPTDIAKLAVFLCSDDASWITGQIYACDGGSLARINFPRRPPPPSPGPLEPIE